MPRSEPPERVEPPPEPAEPVEPPPEPPEPVEPPPELPASVQGLEEEVQRRWEAEDTFRRSLAAREGAPPFVFYEGPPTANGRPGVHHVISRTLKDLGARYRTMTGHHVTRIAGWDTHGLPVEIEAEKQLGISGKAEIEELGIAEFNRVCRENIFTYQDEWERLSRRIGYWLDYDDPYITCSPEYVESCWWALAEIHRKGFLYRGYRVVPYCPRCGTGLSSHEVAQGYREIDDPAVYVKFRLRDDPDGASILSWTTTPWTLPGNLALAVGPEIDYVRVRVLPPEHTGDEGAGPDAGGGEAAAGAAPGEVLILARDRLEEVLRHPVAVLEERKGRDLEGLRYEPLFPGAVDPASAGESAAPLVSLEDAAAAVDAGAGGGGRPASDASGDEGPAWTVVAADFVTVEEGTGVVHTAVMYGEDDFELGRRIGLPMQHTVDDDGRFVDRVPGGLAGRHVRDRETERAIRDWLAGRGLLYRREAYRHAYPHCWRCDSALLYMARDSWYIRTTAVKERLLAHNEAIDWHPPEIGRGRMGEWLANNVDWALSRDRYWGTPLPFWVCDRDGRHRDILGSFAELAERTGGLPADFDPHRPEIDELAWACPAEGCGGEMRRVPQVADAWFDSGSMPWAQWHWPFENEEAFRAHFPADFIAEGVDQTRGWFYSLLALSTLLFDAPAYKSVMVNDLILDARGQKMSKSRGNVVDPWEAIAEHGADAIRFYLVAASNPWIPKRWDPDGIREVDRKLFATLRNTYRFFALYAGLEGWSPGAPDAPGASSTSARPPSGRGVLDRWLLSRLDTLATELGADLEGYDVTRAARRLQTFVLDELSNWYVRRSRDRFWATRPDRTDPEDTADAFATLHEALLTCARALAPFAPFHSDWIWRALGAGGSVHLADFPGDGGRRDPALEREMEDVRQLAALGRAARDQAGRRVRQPLREMKAVVPGGRRPSAALLEVLRDELNVKRVVFLTEDSEIVRLSAKPDFGALGPRFGPRTPAVARAIQEMPAPVVARLREGMEATVSVGGEEVTVRPEEVTVLEEAEGELVVSGAGGYLVALDPVVDEELRTEGIARELVSRVQRLRRDAGLRVADRIRLGIAGSSAVERAAGAHRDYIAGETLAREVLVGEGRAGRLEHTEQVRIEQDRATIGVERVDADPGSPG